MFRVLERSQEMLGTQVCRRKCSKEGNDVMSPPKPRELPSAARRSPCYCWEAPETTGKSFGLTNGRLPTGHHQDVLATPGHTQHSKASPMLAGFPPDQFPPSQKYLLLEDGQNQVCHGGLFTQTASNQTASVFSTSPAVMNQMKSSILPQNKLH